MWSLLPVAYIRVSVYRTAAGGGGAGGPVARDSVAAGGYSGNRARDAEARTGGEVQVARAEIPIPRPGRCRWREDPSVAVRIYRV